MAYIVVLILVVIMHVILHFYNMSQYKKCNKYLLNDQVDAYIASNIGEYDNSEKRYDFVFAKNEIPLGRASAFLNFFDKTIYTEEPYLFLCKRSTVDNEFREYGCIFARTGFYYSEEKKINDRNSNRARQKEISFLGLTQLWAIGKCIISVYVRPNCIFDKVRATYISDKRLVQLIKNVGKTVVANDIGLCLTKGQVAEIIEREGRNEHVVDGAEYVRRVDIDTNVYDQVVEREENILKKQGDHVAVEDAGVVAGFPKIRAFFGEIKNYMNGSRGHGYAAEYANNTVDRALGRDVENAAQILDEHGRQVKHGADRIVNGKEIQTKYYKTASETIGAVFEHKEAIYIRSDGSEKMMQIEVPRDQYQDALKAMQKRIDSGQVPNVEPGETAKDYVRKGFFTYEQSFNVARAGTIESLSVDITSGAVCCAQAAGISALIIFAQGIWRGETPADAAKKSLESGLAVMGKGTLIYALTLQLSRKEVANVLAGKVFTADGISQGYMAINNPVYNLAENMADSLGKSAFANSGVGQKLGLNNVTGRQLIGNTVTVVVVFGPDVVRTLQGKISTKQLFKNSVIGAIGMAGAAIGQTIIPIPIVGAMVGGAVSGFVAKKVLDNYIEDDAKEMFRVLKEEFIDQTMLANLSQEEFDEIAKLTVGHKKISKLLQNMYQSGEERRYAREAIMLPAIMAITKKRARISMSAYGDAIIDVVSIEL